MYCQDVNLAQSKGMRRICETELVPILSKKAKAQQNGSETVNYTP